MRHVTEKRQLRNSKLVTTGFRGSKSAITLLSERRSNKKKSAASDGKETIQRFHRNLRISPKTTRRRNNAKLDGKYGRWLPQNRYNVDQVPLPFVIDQDKTYEMKGSEHVWVSQPSSGLDKRQATLQLCIRAEGQQNVKPGIVFRGKGNVSTEEKAQYDEGVDVYFHSCAWIHSHINMEWVTKTLAPGIGNSPEEKVIFADNVTFHMNSSLLYIFCLKTTLTRYNPLMQGLVKC